MNRVSKSFRRLRSMHAVWRLHLAINCHLTAGAASAVALPIAEHLRQAAEAQEAQEGEACLHALCRCASSHPESRPRLVAAGALEAAALCIRMPAAECQVCAMAL